MLEFLSLIIGTSRSALRGRKELILENLLLRQQLQVALRPRRRLSLEQRDRLFWVLVRRIFPDWRRYLLYVRPETVIRWHRGGWRRYWAWRSRTRLGRPRLSAEVRLLIARMAGENPLWGTERIRGELLKLGLVVSSRSIRRYRRRQPARPPRLAWRPFLHNGGSAARRTLRWFIGRWMNFRLHTWPRDDVRKRILVQLAQQGWHIRDDHLVVGEQQAAALESVSPSGRQARIANLHATVRQVADRYIDSGHLEVAIFEAFKTINNRVRELAGIDPDGSDLMAKALRDDSPPIPLADLSSESGRNIQAGFRFLFMGAVRRNPQP
jgi:uncharacterized protein (TIGR02391 family)